MSLSKNIYSLFACSLLAVSCSNVPMAEETEDDPTQEVDTRLEAGKRCEENAECKSGFCIEILGARQCAARCTTTATCVDKLVCAVANPRQANSPKICMPKAKLPCMECIDDSDCQEIGAMCHEIDGNKVCMGPCEDDTSCPTGYGCQEVTETVTGNLVKQCWPEINTCSCDSASSGAERQCYNHNAAGTCYGLQKCTADGWQECDAQMPTEEICDGLDNDCDGQTDEDEDGDPLTQVCQYGYAGTTAPAECRGISICQEGAFDNCSLTVPPLTETTCDGLDNDCDGLIDEDAAGQPLVQSCQYGYEGVEAPENCRGIQTCEAGSFGRCSTPEPPEFESLCDNIDEDCDGYTDAADHQGTPLSISCGYGYDDNTDLRPEECIGQRVCSQGTYGTCDFTPAVKDLQCDGKDDDCDGLIDEDILGTNYNCTKCGDVCPGAGKANVAKWGCQSGACIDWSCRFPYFDVNGLESDGCEVNDPLVNYKPSLSYYLGAISECDEGDEWHYCNGRLPRDGRKNISNNNDMSNYEGQDFFYFYYKANTWCSKEAVLKVVANRLTGNINSAIRVCLSDAYSSTTSNPQFTDSSRCKTIYMGSYSSKEISFDKSYFSASDSNYYYIKVESLSDYAKFAGSFHIQIMEKEADNDITGGSSVCK